MKKKTYITSDPLNYSYAYEMEYQRDLRSLVKKMTDEVVKKLINVYGKNKESFAMDGAFNNVDDILKELEKKYRDLFTEKGEEYAKKMIMRQVRYSRTKFKEILKKLYPDKTQPPSIKGSVIPRDLYQDIRASMLENVSLIKSIQSKYFEQITGSLTRSMQYGGSLAQLKKEILKYDNITQKRANLIAHDQTRKAYMSINLRNMKNSGIQKAMWVHSGGGEPRPYHIAKWDGISGIKDGKPNGLNGFVFDINNPPVIQHQHGKQQEIRGYPAQLVNCKCVLKAVIELEEI